jgi:Raf kinase inhibitor-like YbhB/YbcL family protein
MKITSTAFKHNKMIPREFSCQGEGLNPPLLISESPEDTKSLALVVHDHDGLEGDFVHWLIWNIDPKVPEIKEGWMPIDALEGVNDAGKVGWVPPCPSSGKHRYEFHLYALDTILDLLPTSNKSDFRDVIKGKVLAEASLVGVYEKAPV